MRLCDLAAAAHLVPRPTQERRSERAGKSQVLEPFGISDASLTKTAVFHVCPSNCDFKALCFEGVPRGRYEFLKLKASFCIPTGAPELVALTFERKQGDGVEFMNTVRACEQYLFPFSPLFYQIRVFDTIYCQGV